MLRVICPKGRDELVAFSEEYRAASGAYIDLEFLELATVYGMASSDANGREVMAGGLVVRNRPPYRSMTAIPPEANVTLPGSVLELVGLFIHREHRTAKARAFVAFGCFLAILLSRQQYLLAITTKASLFKKTYQFLGAKVIYEGELSLNPVAKQHGWVFVIERRTFFRRLPLYVAYRPLQIFNSKLASRLTDALARVFPKSRKESTDESIKQHVRL